MNNNEDYLNLFDEFGNYIGDQDSQNSSEKKEILDSNGVVLSNGDKIIITQDIKSKNSKDVIKRGTVMKNIKLCDMDDHIMCKVGKSTLYIKTCYVKKS